MLISTFKEKLPHFSELEYGYFEKHTGKRWIENDKDLDAMYRGFNAKDDITLWCEGKPSDDSGKKLGRRENRTRLKMQRSVGMHQNVLLGRLR